MNPVRELKRLAGEVKNPWGGDYEVRLEKDRVFVKETDGSQLGDFVTKEEAYKFINDRMKRKQFYSDVWLIGDYYEDRQNITNEVMDFKD